MATTTTPKTGLPPEAAGMLVAVILKNQGGGSVKGAATLQILKRSDLQGQAALWVNDPSVLKVELYEITDARLVGRHEMTATTEGLLAEVVKK